MNARGSAEGAEYERQGQAPNNVRRVAPGRKCAKGVKLCKSGITDIYISHFQCSVQNYSS
jgi:hypothetical protein